jgi:hypothetical protein
MLFKNTTDVMSSYSLGDIGNAVSWLRIKYFSSEINKTQPNEANQTKKNPFQNMCIVLEHIFRPY